MSTYYSLALWHGLNLPLVLSLVALAGEGETGSDIRIAGGQQFGAGLPPREA